MATFTTASTATSATRMAAAARFCTIVRQVGWYGASSMYSERFTAAEIPASDEV
jgi:hypothetical protein